jgi:hypothetical protein
MKGAREMTKANHFVWNAALLAAFCSISIFANPRDKDKDKDAEVKFTARTELVLIPTLVTDKSGNHITGLKKEDFTVLENGVEQKVATFEEITSDTHRWTHANNPSEFSNTSCRETLQPPHHAHRA